MTTAACPAPLTWVIGRGGLLGQGLERVIREKADPNGLRSILWSPSGPITWSVPSGGAIELGQQTERFLRAAGNRPWSVAWCAGAGVMGTSPQTLRLELAALG